MWMWALIAPAALGADCGVAVEDARVPAAEAALAFAPRSAELTASSGEAIAGVSCLLEADPALTVQVEVHTDSQGSGSYNLRMSQERADAVRVALLATGVSPERVTAVGYGEIYPLDTNTTAAGRGTNRRIELHTSPPSERPPRPETQAPAPALRPLPEPRIDLCTSVAMLQSDQPPSWPQTACAVEASTWRCLIDMPFATAAATLQGCTEARLDGTELFLMVDGASFRLTDGDGGTTLEPR